MPRAASPRKVWPSSGCASFRRFSESASSATVPAGSAANISSAAMPRRSDRSDSSAASRAAAPPLPPTRPAAASGCSRTMARRKTGKRLRKPVTRISSPGIPLRESTARRALRSLAALLMSIIMARVGFSATDGVITRSLRWRSRIAASSGGTNMSSLPLRPVCRDALPFPARVDAGRQPPPLAPKPARSGARSERARNIPHNALPRGALRLAARKMRTQFPPWQGPGAPRSLTRQGLGCSEGSAPAGHTRLRQLCRRSATDEC